LVHTSTRRGRPGRPRILYWFRTPPGVKIGREPFDEHVRRTIEQRYPDLTFDWEKLRVLPAFPPDVERWRERRRAERAAKHARLAETEAGEAADAADPSGESPNAVETNSPAQDEVAAGPSNPAADARGATGAGGAPERDAPPADVIAGPPEIAAQPRPAAGRRRRRRGGWREAAGRKGPGPNAPVDQGAAAPAPGLPERD
jgi:hypothetical protein